MLKHDQDRDFDIWQYKNVRVFYQPDLDGRGSVLAQPFVSFIKEHAAGRQFDSAFEWCAGPGFIGFALLEEGLCNHLCLADINPQAIECVKRTVQENGLTGKVNYYVSDNFARVPKSEKFDLVVANPPNYHSLNPRHSKYSLYRDDLRPNDPGWKIHRAFYCNVRQYLNPEALLYISEVEPYKDKVYEPCSESEPYDIRDRPAIEDFLQMIADAGLIPVETTHYFTGKEGPNLFLMVSQNPIFSNKVKI